jgi:hypothetical protein
MRKGLPKNILDQKTPPEVTDEPREPIQDSCLDDR